MCSICLFDNKKNRRYFYKRKDCIERFCKDLKELVTEIINFEEKEMIQLGPMKNQKYVVYVKKSFVTIKTRKKSEIIAITPEKLEELLIVNAI